MESSFLSGIDQLLALLEQQRREEVPTEPEVKLRGTPPPTLPSRPLEDLGLLTMRLTQIKEWLEHEPQLLALVDQFIGKQIQQSEVRQTKYARNLTIITTVAGALLGWLLSTITTPSALWHVFFP